MTTPDGNTPGGAQTWDRHWQAARLSSSEEEQALLEIAGMGADWQQFFTGLPAGAAILDIGTGNGLVPLLAVQAGAGKNFRITGIDAADIAPMKYLGQKAAVLKDVTFIGRTRAEELPFGDAAFDAVTGQHALEYTDTEKTVPEIARVTKSGGQVLFHMHGSDSALVGANRPKIAQFRHILEASPILEYLEKAILMERKGKTEMARSRAEALQKEVQSLSRRFQADTNTRDMARFLGHVVQAWQGRKRLTSEADLRTWIRGLKSEIADTVARIRAMTGAALSREDAEQLSLRFQEAGFEISDLSQVPLRGSDRTAGWRLCGKRVKQKE